MIIRPSDLNAYEFVVISSLRAQQLMAGCTPRLAGLHSATTMAQMEVASGCVVRAVDPSPTASQPVTGDDGNQ
jgi:DNA-directed RNA polymerase subunit K/omega